MEQMNNPSNKENAPKNLMDVEFSIPSEEAYDEINKNDPKELVKNKQGEYVLKEYYEGDSPTSH